MGYPTKVQLIQRKGSQQWYVNFPAAVAEAMGFQRGEVVEWTVESIGVLALQRTALPKPLLKKTTLGSSTPSSASGSGRALSASRREHGKKR